MATRTVKPAGGAWESTTTWVEGIVPTSVDDVVCNATSGNLSAGLGSPPKCKTLNFTGYTGTFTHYASYPFYIYGNCTFVAGMTYTRSGSPTIVLSGAGTFSTGGKTFSYVQVNAPGGAILQVGNLTVTGFLLYKGTYDANNYNVTAGYFDGNAWGADVRALYMGSGTWTITGYNSTTGMAWNFTGSTITLYAETSTLVINISTDYEASFYAGYSPGKLFTYNNVEVMANSGSQPFRFIIGLSCVNLTIHGKRTVCIDSLTTIKVTGDFTCPDTSATSRVTLVPTSVSYGVWYIWSVNNDVNVSHISVSKSSASGKKFFASSSINAGGNIGWLFTLVDIDTTVAIQGVANVLINMGIPATKQVFPSENDIGGGKDITEKYLAILFTALCKGNGFVVSGLNGPALSPNPGLVFTISPGVAFILGRYIEIPSATVINLTPSPIKVIQMSYVYYFNSVARITTGTVKHLLSVGDLVNVMSVTVPQVNLTNAVVTSIVDEYTFTYYKASNTNYFGVDTAGTVTILQPQSSHYITLGLTINNSNVTSVQFGYTNSVAMPINAIRLYRVTTEGTSLSNYTDYRPRLNNNITVPI